MKNTDIAAVLVAQKVMAALEVDPKTLAQVVNIMKTIADNGVPAVEIARVLSDGLMPKEMIDLVAEKVFAALEKDIQPADVDLHVKVYDNLKLKANIPQDVIEYIDNKLIQVRDYSMYIKCFASRTSGTMGKYLTFSISKRFWKYFLSSLILFPCFLKTFPSKLFVK